MSLQNEVKATEVALAMNTSVLNILIPGFRENYYFGGFKNVKGESMINWKPLNNSRAARRFSDKEEMDGSIPSCST